MSTTCTSPSCPDEVLWLENDHTHRRAPIQAVPLPEGNCVVDVRHGTYHVLTKAEQAPSLFDGPGAARHWPHFALCRDVTTYIRRCGSCKQTKCIEGPACRAWRQTMQDENDARRRKFGLT